MKNFFRYASLLVLTTITLLSLAGCGEDNKRITECLEYETAIDSGTCIANIALERDTEKSALKICDRIENGVHNTCIRTVAIKFENKALCFDNENEIETYICLGGLAEKKQDSTICAEIERKKDENFCYRKVAVATLDQSHCESIDENDSFKQTCIQSVEFAKTTLEENDSEDEVSVTLESETAEVAE